MGSFTSNYYRYVEKQLVITEDATIILHINGIEILTSDIGFPSNYTPKNKEELENILNLFDKINICNGVMLSNEYTPIVTSYFGQDCIQICGQYHHLKCLKVLSEKDSKYCVWCQRLIDSIKRKKYRMSNGKSLRPNFSPNKKQIVINLRKTKKAILKNFSRANRKINRLQSSLNDCKNKMKELSDSNISEILENSAIPKCQSELILYSGPGESDLIPRIDIDARDVCRPNFLPPWCHSHYTATCIQRLIKRVTHYLIWSGRQDT